MKCIMYSAYDMIKKGEYLGRKDGDKVARLPDAQAHKLVSQRKAMYISKHEYRQIVNPKE